MVNREMMIVMRLTDSQINEFFDKGYVILTKVFSKDEIKMMSDSMDRIYQESQKLKNKTQIHEGTQFVFENSALHRVVWAGAFEPSLLKIGEDPRLLGPASQLLGSNEMDQLINQIHFKVPGDNVGFPWHQDTENRGYGTPEWIDVNHRGSYVQTTIAVDRQRVENGTMYFIPESCKLGHLGLENLKDKETKFDVSKKVPLIMDPGDVAMFGPYTIHGSFPNESEEPRRILINGYAYPGANKRAYPGKGSGRRLRYQLPLSAHPRHQLDI